MPYSRIDACYRLRFSLSVGCFFVQTIPGVYGTQRERKVVHIVASELTDLTQLMRTAGHRDAEAFGGVIRNKCNHPEQPPSSAGSGTQTGAGSRHRSPTAAAVGGGVARPPFPPGFCLLPSANDGLWQL